MSRCSSVDISTSRAFREVVLSFIREFLGHRQLLFREFKRLWISKRMYHIIWGVYPVQSAYNPDSFIIFIFDGALDMLDLGLQGSINRAVWNVSIIFTIYMLHQITKAKAIFSSAHIPQRLCVLRMSLRQWARFGEITEAICQLGHAGLEALYIIEQMHAGLWFSVGIRSALKYTPCSDSRGYLSYVPYGCDTTPHDSGVDSVAINGIIGIDCSETDAEIALAGWLTCASHPEYAGVLGYDPDVWDRGGDAHVQCVENIDSIIRGANTQELVVGESAIEIGEASTTTQEEIGKHVMPSRAKRSVGSVALSQSALGTLLELEEMLKICSASSIPPLQGKRDSNEPGGSKSKKSSVVMPSSSTRVASSSKRTSMLDGTQTSKKGRNLTSLGSDSIITAVSSVIGEQPVVNRHAFNALVELEDMQKKICITPIPIHSMTGNGIKASKSKKSRGSVSGDVPALVTSSRKRTAASKQPVSIVNTSVSSTVIDVPSAPVISAQQASSFDAGLSILASLESLINESQSKK